MSPASARNPHYRSTASPYTRATQRLALHTNGVLKSKCLSTFKLHKYMVLTRWQARHKAAHKRKKACPVLPPHNALWECIHGGEGAWDDQGDPYWGGLQMHPGWGGVHHASDLSPLAQKWLAERELRKNGYSASWVAGQWPISHRSCMQHL